MPAADCRGVLVTRPAPGDAATAQAVARLGWQPILAPSLVLAALPSAVPPPRGAQALLLTSAAAARALARGGVSADLAVFAVGDATASAARAIGFTRVEAAGGDAESLAALVSARCDPRGGTLWLAIGRGYGAELAAMLRGQGFRVVRRVAYTARPVMALPAAASRALATGRVAAALFTSPRGARSMVHLLRRAGLLRAAGGIVAIAISQRVADALDGVAWKALLVATIPAEAALLETLGPAPARTTDGGLSDQASPRAAKKRMEQTPP